MSDYKGKNQFCIFIDIPSDKLIVGENKPNLFQKHGSGFCSYQQESSICILNKSVLKEGKKKILLKSG